MTAVFEKDWAFFKASVPDLQQYLFSDQLYWPVTIHAEGRRESASLTPGNLLLTAKRLRAGIADAQCLNELDALNNEMDYIRERWRSNWMQKCEKEFSPRLRLWEGYLRDLSEDIETHGKDYPQDVRWRTILHLLKGEMGRLSDQQASQLSTLDATLRSLAIPSAFVWEAELAGSFPREIYWFLYLAFSKKAEGGS
ncbi:MAG: hypothetical protein HPY45_01945 [Anaerolineae bacterium]|nr:hypothetical protein [Anaerolineae bacterium]